MGAKSSPKHRFDIRKPRKTLPASCTSRARQKLIIVKAQQASDLTWFFVRPLSLVYLEIGSFQRRVRSRLSSPAESQANFGTWVIGGQGAATHRRHPWSGERVVNASASDNPSGRNLWAASKRRPRITSSSMSQRTRLEDWMQL